MKFPFVIVVPSLKVNGMALFPFILVREVALKQDKVLIRHETIHLRQEFELLILPFYILYLTNYIINRTKYQDHYEAYFNIAFEREAYTYEAQTDYLQKRKPYAWFKFVTFKK